LNQDEKSLDIFEKLLGAIEIYEYILGFDHPDTADMYSKLSLAYFEAGNYQEASNWIWRTFITFYKCFGAEDEITLNAYEMLRNIEAHVESGIDLIPYDELP